MDVSLKLRVIVTINNINKSKWDGVVYSRHGGPNHQSWWYHKIKSDLSLHTPDGSLSTFDLSNTHISAYVRVVNKYTQKY